MSTVGPRGPNRFMYFNDETGIVCGPTGATELSQARQQFGWYRGYEAAMGDVLCRIREHGKNDLTKWCEAASLAGKVLP